MPQIWLRVDAAGVHAVMKDEQDELSCVGDVDWHFVAIVEDRQEGERLIRLLHREHEHRLAVARTPLRMSAKPQIRAVLESRHLIRVPPGDREVRRVTTTRLQHSEVPF